MYTQLCWRGKNKKESFKNGKEATQSRTRKKYIIKAKERHEVIQPFGK